MPPQVALSDWAFYDQSMPTWLPGLSPLHVAATRPSAFRPTQRPFRKGLQAVAMILDADMVRKPKAIAECAKHSEHFVERGRWVFVQPKQHIRVHGQHSA